MSRRESRRRTVANKLWLHHMGRSCRIALPRKHWPPEMRQRWRREARRDRRAWRSHEDQRRRGLWPR